MFIKFDVFTVGLLFLIVYIIIDLIRQKTKYLLKRIVFYSFLVYLLVVVQLTTGGIAIPPQKDLSHPVIQPIPGYFIWDWIQQYRKSGLDWFFWNSVKLSLENLIMLLPLGIYLPVLFRVKSFKRLSLITFLISLTIETYQFILGYAGFIFGRTSNVDDLILNTLGGVIGYLCFEYIRKTIKMLNRKQAVDKAN